MSDGFQKKLEELLSPRAANDWLALLPAIRAIKNIDSKLSRISHITDREDLQDYLCELRFALVFRSLNFDVRAEPLGKKGPDFLIERDNKSVMLECTRFRNIYPGPPMTDHEDKSPKLEPYGNVERDIQKAFTKIIDKMPQVSGSDAIIGIWNDDGDLEEIEVSMAVQGIVEDVVKERYSIPGGLLAVVYGSPWITVDSLKQLHCYPLWMPMTKWFQELVQVEVNKTLATLQCNT